MIRKIALASSVLLAACGGGGEDGGSGAPSPENFVSGSFYDAAQTGKSFPADRATHGYYGFACVGETNYFETDSGRVRIYGSTAYSSADFEAMATMIDQRLDGMLAKFDLNWELFKQERSFLTVQGLQNVLQEMREDERITQPETFDYNQEIAHLYDTWRQWSREEQVSYVEGLPDYLNEKFADVDLDGFVFSDDDYPRLDGDVVIGCLAQGMSGSTFGEGYLAGISMPPEYQQWPGGTGEIVNHELVHFIQQNLYNEATHGYVIPRWFSEGQAVYMAGQSVASKNHHHNYDPVTVIGFHDEYGDIGTAYEHYGLAYSYIAKSNELTAIVDMLRLMKDTVDNPMSLDAIELENNRAGDGLGEYVAFAEAFEASIVDHEGQPLTIERYRTTYHDLMNSW